MKIFLDDIRIPFDCISYMYRRIGKDNVLYSEGGWSIVRNYDDFVEIVTQNIDKITHISFDHDLADDHYTGEMYKSAEEYYKSIEGTERTGYDCAKWLKQFYQEKGKQLPTMFVHSMNPVGTENIINVFK